MDCRVRIRRVVAQRVFGDGRRQLHNRIRAAVTIRVVMVDRHCARRNVVSAARARARHFEWALFWLKQNDIGIPLAIVLYLALSFFFRAQKRVIPQVLLAMSVGALLVSALVILPFAWHGALAQFWDAAFLYNFVYIEETWLDRFLILRYIPVFLPALGLTLFATVGGLIATLAFAEGARQRQSVWTRWGDTLDALWGERAREIQNALPRGQVLVLIAIVMIGLPIELILVSLSGNGFDHYFLALLPVFAVLAAFTFRIVLAMLKRVALARWAIAVFVLALLAVLLLFAAEDVQSVWQRLVRRENTAIIHYLAQNTAPRDEIYIWGSEARVSFEAKRRSATRFIYGAPFSRRGYATPTKTREFLHDLLARKPRFMLDIHAPNHPFLTFPLTTSEIESLKQQLVAAYQERATIEGWTIYERRAP